MQSEAPLTLAQSAKARRSPIHPGVRARHWATALPGRAEDTRAHPFMRGRMCVCVGWRGLAGVHVRAASARGSGLTCACARQRSGRVPLRRRAARSGRWKTTRCAATATVRPTTRLEHLGRRFRPPVPRCNARKPVRHPRVPASTQDALETTRPVFAVRNAMRCNAMRCDAMQCDAMRCNAMQCPREVGVREDPSDFRRRCARVGPGADVEAAGVRCVATVRHVWFRHMAPVAGG